MTLSEYCSSNSDALYLLEQYSDENNIGADEISKGSNRKVIWHCKKCGYKWNAIVYSRTKNLDECAGCRYVRTGQTNKLLRGINDLHTYCLKNPEYKYIEDEILNYDDQIDTTKIASMSRDILNYKCITCGFEWSGPLYRRVNVKTRCEACNSRDKNVAFRCIEGVNDLKTLHLKGEITQDIVDDWDEERNMLLGRELTNTSKGTIEKLYWTCSICGDTYLMSVADRVRGHKGCSCRKGISTSIPEQTIYNAFKDLFRQTLNREKMFGYEYDIIVPELSLAIEYNSSIYHDNQQKFDREKAKREQAENNGMKYVSICDNLFKNKEFMFEDAYICRSYQHGFKEDIKNIIEEILVNTTGNKYNIDIDKALKEANIGCKKSVSKNLADVLYEIGIDIHDYWNAELNADAGINLDDVSYGSGKLAYFNVGGEVKQYKICEMYWKLRRQ